MRAGPGTGYAIVGTLAESDRVVVMASTEERTWLQLGEGRWLVASVVDGVPPGLPAVTVGP